MRSLVCSAIDIGLIDKVGGAVAIPSVEYRLSTPVAEFSCLLEKLNALCDALLDSNRDIQFARLKSEEKSTLETKMRENLQKTRSKNIKKKEVDELQCRVEELQHVMWLVRTSFNGPTRLPYRCLLRKTDKEMFVKMASKTSKWESATIKAEANIVPPEGD